MAHAKQCCHLAKILRNSVPFPLIFKRSKCLQLTSYLCFKLGKCFTDFFFTNILIFFVVLLIFVLFLSSNCFIFGLLAEHRSSAPFERRLRRSESKLEMWRGGWTSQKKFSISSPPPAWKWAWPFRLSEYFEALVLLSSPYSSLCFSSWYVSRRS